MISITKVYADGSDTVTVLFSGGVSDPGPADLSFRAGANASTPVYVEQPNAARVRFPEAILPGDAWAVDQQPGWLAAELDVPANGTCEAYA